MKTLRSSYDLSQEDILEIIQKTRKIENGEGTDLDRKILGILTYNPSLRTTTALAHSMIKSGGNYISLDNTYLKENVEDLEDTVKGISEFIDVLGIRTTPELPIKDLNAEIPIVNCSCGDEHTSGALYILYTFLKRTRKRPEELKIGVYGQTRYSTPMNAIYRTWAKLGITFYEDPVIDELGITGSIKQELNESGGNIEQCSMENFPKELDFVIISSGNFGKWVEKSLLNQYLEKFRPVTLREVNSMPDSTYWYCIEPRGLPDGNLTMSKELDGHEKLLNKAGFKESLFVNQGLFEWMLI